MFKADMQTILFIYLIIVLLPVLGIFLYFEIVKKARKDKKVGEKHVFKCKICAFSYIIGKNDELSRCPRCGSWDEVDNNW